MADHASTLLVQFARAPVPGRVKTRMLGALSAEEACELHRQMVLWTARTLVRSELGTVRMAVEGDRGDKIFETCRALGVAGFRRQVGNDLGQRMAHAVSEALTAHERVILVGSDCPFIDQSYLEAAVAALDTAPVVIGPASDGGYVLVGLTEVEPRLFEGIPWGGGEVLHVTRRVLEQLGLAWRELETLDDIDRPEDLPLWEEVRSRAGVAPPVL